jgi:RNA ligase (TIGR02306 family)
MNLASVQKIVDIQPIEGADAIEKVQVLGWWVVTKKGEYKVGDLCSYIQIDTIVPEKEEFEFLRKSNFRVKTIKLRQQISQGLIVPLPTGKWKEGDDLTEILGVKKYSKIVEVEDRPERAPKIWWKKYLLLFFMTRVGFECVLVTMK